MRLSKFINENIELILQEWENFAITLDPLISANKAQLRDHAKAMLAVICSDLDCQQSTQEGISKSRGNAPVSADETAAESHAVDRMQSGFTVQELMAEYRALRASVLRLWQEQIKTANEFDLQDMLRFNEAIDQALTESIAKFSSMVLDSQNVFLAILGHDARNPLGAISMGTQMIMQDTDLPVRHLKVAAQIFRSTQRVTDLLSDLLDYSTSHLGGGIPVTLAEYNLSLECRSVVQEMQLFHPEKDFAMEIQEDVLVTWDRARMSQAISNLIANAVQHGRSSTPIWITLTRNGENAVIVVKNEGEKIPPNKLRTLFNPNQSFAIKSISERSASTTNNLGLGLYITHEIVVAHGGNIRVSSTQSEGTAITVEIPTTGKISCA